MRLFIDALIAAIVLLFSLVKIPILVIKLAVNLFGIIDRSLRLAGILRL